MKPPISISLAALGKERERKTGRERVGGGERGGWGREMTLVLTGGTEREGCWGGGEMTLVCGDRQPPPC